MLFVQSVFNTAGVAVSPMSGSGRVKLKLAADLVSRGATMLSEPCPKCGGIQVKYRGKVYCTSHDDLSTVGSSETMSVESVVVRMREVLLARLNEAAASLAIEKDMGEQERLVALMTACFKLLQELPEK